MDILRISYKSTNYYFIKSSKYEDSFLAFDTGWPGTYREYKGLLKERGFRVDNIKWMIVSHFHIDHAGLSGMLLNKGVEFIVLKNQIESISEMEDLIKRKSMDYEKIDINRIKVLEVESSRKWLDSIGILGEVLITNCHTEDSISLVLDNGIAFIGDLPPENNIIEGEIKCKKAWELLRNKKVKFIKPAHGKEFKLIQINREKSRFFE